MRLLVFGGRAYDDQAAAFAYLDRINAKRPVSLIIEGGARGADRLGKLWATERGVPVKTFPADWNALGKRAGFVRNQQMIDEGRPDGALGLPGGNGTADMARRCKMAGVTVWQPLG